jgi:L-fucose isomerase-like protein
MTLPSNVRFKFIPFSSDLNYVPSNESVDEYVSFLKNYGGEATDNIDEETSLPLFIFVMSGGTESKVLELWKKNKEHEAHLPFYLIAHPGNNSLPAALEILARLKQDGGKGKIIYLGEDSNKSDADELDNAIKHLTVFYNLKKARVGLIGNPSDWLIASTPDTDRIKEIWGPETIKIDMDELKHSIEEISESEIEENYFSFTQRAVETKEPTKKELKQVVKVYSAIKQLVQKYNLTAVSVRCFDLVTDLKTTGCYALSKLNDDSIVAGCEGDLVSTIGMIWASLMTDQSIWMANPARINGQTNSIWLAHCTTPLNLVQSYKLRSHFESGLGVGIQGEFSKGKVTLFRLGGKNMGEIWISNGEILETGNEENLCRTQVNIKLHGTAKPEDLLMRPLGNHLLMMRGSYTKELHTWWDSFIKS